MVAAQTATAKNEKRGISGSTLKIIALVTMLIDHIGAVILQTMLFADISANFNPDGSVKHNALYITYTVMRAIGRIAFPLFIFLLVEGLMHTTSRWKYLLRMLVFSVLSEVPFDLALTLTQKNILEKKFFEFGYQNVFFTLTVGLLTITLIDWLWKSKLFITFQIILSAGFCVGGFLLAEFLRTDYGGMGVLAIAVAYFLRRWKMASVTGAVAVLTAMSLTEACAFIDLLPVAFYNGKRGLNFKWAFYIFYPLHLFILGLIKFIIF